MTLSKMVPGDTGSIKDISATGALGQRLMDLGFYPGARVRVNGALAADGGDMTLNATNWREMKAGTGPRARGGHRSAGKAKSGKVDQVAKAEPPAGDAKADDAQPAKKYSKKPKKSGGKAADQWDTPRTKKARNTGKTDTSGDSGDGSGWMTPYDPDASDAAGK